MLDGCVRGSDLEVNGLNVHVCDEDHGAKVYYSHRDKCVRSVYRTPGYTMGLCARCGAFVSVSPAGQQLLALRNLEVVCCHCEELPFKPGTKTDPAVMTIAQFREVLETRPHVREA